MKPGVWQAAMVQRWQGFSPRERWLLAGLGVFLLSVAAFSLIWQPTQARLARAELEYQRQLEVAAQLQQARPRQSVPTTADQPLALRISESASVAGLELQQLASDAIVLRLTISGDAVTLLAWLDQLERDGVVLQSLTLDTRDATLEARVELR